MPIKKSYFVDELQNAILQGKGFDKNDPDGYAYTQLTPQELQTMNQHIIDQIQQAKNNHVVFTESVISTLVHTAEQLEHVEILFMRPTFIDFENVAFGGDIMYVRGIAYYPAAGNELAHIILYTYDYRQKSLHQIKSSTGRLFWSFHQLPCPKRCMRPSEDDGSRVYENKRYDDCVCYEALQHWLYFVSAASILFDRSKWSADR